MGIIEFSLKRRVTVAMVAIAVSMFGAVAFSRLPINLLPDISYPSLTVESRFSGAAPAEVESLLTRPIEEAVGVVAGVKRLTSVSRPGLSQVTLEFDWGRNMDFAALDVRQKLDLVSLPRDSSKPVLLRFDPANDPIMRLYLSGTEDLFQLRYLGEEVLKKDLESTEGVAAIKVNGGYEEEIQVQVDEGKLALLGLDIAAVRDRLAQENINQAGGSLYEKEARYLVRSRNEFEKLGDILETVLFNQGNRIVTLADVAEIDRGHRQREVVTRYDGDEAVELALYKEGDANTVQVARAVQARLEKIGKELPEGIEISTGTDQSGFIQASIQEVLNNASLGGLIAIVILLLFLKDPRSTLIIGISIPLSVVATFFLMYRTGTSLNIMSLGGLALGVGMLVDNAIVVLEAIYKRREQGDSPLEAARRGASEVGRAVIASTLTTVAVFLPVIFLEGVAAQLFRDQALTVSFSLIASLAVSLTLIPMLAALVTGQKKLEAVPPLMTTLKAALVQPRPTFEKPSRINTLISLLVAVTGPVLRFIFFVIPTLILWILRFFLVGLYQLLGFIAKPIGYQLLGFIAKPIGWLFDETMAIVSSTYPKVLRWSLRAPALVLTVALAAMAGAVWLVPSLGLDLIPTLSR